MYELRPPAMIWILSVFFAVCMADERALQEDAECAASADCSLNALQMGSAAKTSDEEDSTENDIDEEGVSSHTNSSIPLHGYHHWATTTMYGDAPHAACGGINTKELTAGTRYHSVASAQAMWKDCNRPGCWCGQSGGGHGTTGMGCLSCAKGRFLCSAYGVVGHHVGLAEVSSEAQESTSCPFRSEELLIVVSDICPHAPNKAWCPASPGHKNAYGSFNHLDFSNYPDSIPHNPSIPNLNFVFSRIECPADLKQRYRSMTRCK
ncbi:Vwa8 [Symbiodinium natans]|uniref:Vwa8 protein n=1 Tax=Symbiodinium natans TaxID=878477 RepID=A0A812R802_9DINO|nr:Vwa8 [Symbiodinium natans]